MSTAARAPAARALAVGERACPQCGGEAIRALPRYSAGGWRIVACTACGFVYLRNPPSYESLADEFEWEKMFDLESERRHQARPKLMWVERKTRWRLHFGRRSRADLYRSLFRPGRVLDVGCGGGSGVPEPFVPFGIEISPALYEQAAVAMAARGGRAVRGPAADVIRGFASGYFSGVILSSVVEHEVRPKPLLGEVARVLEADGAAYIRVPNFGGLNRMVNGRNWCGIRHPDHVNYFTVSSLRRMAADCGLALRLLHPLRLPVDDNINAVLTRA